MGIVQPPRQQRRAGAGRLEVIETADHKRVLVHRLSRRREVLTIAIVVIVAAIVAVIFVVASTPAGGAGERQYTITPVRPQ